MFALLALLANLAVTAVSAQDANTHRFNKRLSSGCGLDWPVSCSANPPPSDLCCYESPGVRRVRYYYRFPLMLTYVLGTATPNTGLSTLIDCVDTRLNFVSSGTRTLLQVPAIAGLSTVGDFLTCMRFVSLSNASRSLARPVMPLRHCRWLADC